MLKRLISATFCLYALTTFAQTGGEERILFEGVITDTDHQAVSYAHILVKSRNEGVVGDYYGKFRIGVLPGDTLIISAISFDHVIILIPADIPSTGYHSKVCMQTKTVNLKELVVRPWPATYQQFKKEFIEMEIEDPLANLDLHLPSPEEMRMLSYSLSGGFGIRLPLISILYEKFSKEAHSKRTYAEIMKKESADKRYNKNVVSRITGIKDEGEIKKFIDFCALQVQFILDSSDYELYAAIMDCYSDFFKTGADTVAPGE
ncbi:MAG: hypothetical protein M0Q51_10150 [Bacteroidales bacterium]|nr:hypothetical protein [Bacteroidales bacterium]